jgi:hypothetical protein
MTNATLTIIFIANYVALTCDEVNIVDNGSWISIHGYMMQKVPMMISFQKVVDKNRS